MSPYDAEARSRTKRDPNWSGYAVHLTETRDADRHNWITHVETTPATTGDVEMTDTIHQALQQTNLLPSEHLVDTAYIDAQHLDAGGREHGVDLCGPAPLDSTWQACDKTGSDLLCFAIDWEAQTVTCPQGKTNSSWYEREEKGQPVIQVRFSTCDRRTCPMRSQCTRFAALAPAT